MAKTVSEKKLVIIDASNLILGRLASVVAKYLLSGKSVVVVNAENAVVTGERKSIVKEAHARLEIRTLGSKTKSPKHPRRPDGLIRRTVRGMLPRDKPRGKDAFSRLKVYIGVPKEVDTTKTVKPKEAENKSLIRLMTVGEIAQSIGWKPREA